MATSQSEKSIKRHRVMNHAWRDARDGVCTTTDRPTEMDVTWNDGSVSRLTVSPFGGAICGFLVGVGAEVEAKQ